MEITEKMQRIGEDRLRKQAQAMRNMEGEPPQPALAIAHHEYQINGEVNSLQ